jgi:hypothetical protein
MNKPLRYILFWLPMPLLGILNGSLRELVIKNYFDEHVAHRISVITLIILLFGYGQVIRKRLDIISQADAISCGLIWIMLTICFEFGFGHFVFDIPYETLLADYNVLEGRLWPLVLFFAGLLPFILRKQSIAS